MASQIESGISTYTGHFRMLIDVCIVFGDAYNPQNTDLQIASLEAQLASVQTSINNTDTLAPVLITAASARQDKFTLATSLSTRILAAATVLRLPSAVITHIKELVRKLRGDRARKLTEKDMIGANGEPAKHISVSQVSFNEKIEHFNKLIDLVNSQPAYTPTETELTVASLTALLNEMRESNNAVMAATAVLTNARQERDQLLYAPQTGMMDTALLVKEYIKAVFGPNSPQYKEVKHITFRNR